LATVSVIGAAVGDTVCVGFSTPVPGEALVTGAVTAQGVVTVTLQNWGSDQEHPEVRNPIKTSSRTARASATEQEHKTVGTQM
jgi:hypothetical protein